MGLDKFLAHRVAWRRKPGLHKVYTREFSERIRVNMISVGALEVGGGSGFFKQHVPEIFSSDLIPCPWHDLAVDAQYLPCKDSTLNNVVGFDFLHHTPEPMRFLSETTRGLRPSEWVVIVEP